MQVLKTWWCNAHDDMTRCNTQANDMATTANNWKTPGASVSGCHNTPPLWEDLVPRSRIAPEGKRKRMITCKTKLLLWQMSETKEPWKVKPFREKNTTEMNKVDNLCRKRGTRKNKFGQHSGWKVIWNLIEWEELEWRTWHSGWMDKKKERTWYSQFEMKSEESNLTMLSEQKNRS